MSILSGRQCPATGVAATAMKSGTGLTACIATRVEPGRGLAGVPGPLEPNRRPHRPRKLAATYTTHTLLAHAHFFARSACTVTSAHLHACAHTRMAQVSQKVCCSAHVVSLHLAFSSLMSHPSLLSPYDESFPTLTSTTFLPSYTRPKSAGQAHFRTNTEEFGYLAQSSLHTS